MAGRACSSLGPTYGQQCVPLVHRIVDSRTHRYAGVTCTLTGRQDNISALSNRSNPRRQQSLVSLSLTDCRVVPDAKGTLSPVSMRKLKEVVIRNVDAGVVSRYIQCPSIGGIMTLRIAPFTRATWTNSLTVSFTTTDGLGGSILTVVHLTSDALLATTWEVKDLNLILYGVTVIPKLIDVLPDLHTIRIQLTRSRGVPNTRNSVVQTQCHTG